MQTIDLLYLITVSIAGYFLINEIWMWWKIRQALRLAGHRRVQLHPWYDKHGRLARFVTRARQLWRNRVG